MLPDVCNLRLIGPDDSNRICQRRAIRHRQNSLVWRRSQSVPAKVQTPDSLVLPRSRNPHLRRDTFDGTRLWHRQLLHKYPACLKCWCRITLVPYSGRNGAEPRRG